MPIIVLGCAGALNPEMKIGQTFIISSVGLKTPLEKMPIPPELAHFPTASLLTQPKVVKTPNEKEELFQKTQADLVDCEMGYLWEQLNDRNRENIIFVRVGR